MTTNENQIVVYQPNETVRLDVRLENETVWLTQEQIAHLFGTQRPAITKHLANIYKSGELEREGTCSILEHMGNDGKQSYRTMFYNLDAILSVGYRVNSRNATLFRRWATQVLKAYLLKGYAVNARLNQLEDKVDRRLASHDQRISMLESKVDFFVQTQTPPLQGVFYNGQLWDARALVLKLVSGAKRSLILIDNWATVATLDLFAKKRKGVKVSIFTSEHYDKNHVPHRKISAADVATFNAQYPKLAVRYSETFHDRFLIIDDKELYLVGASLKDLGAKCFAFTRLDPGDITRIKKMAFSTSTL
ncbi:MAG: virulence RhuM family protein [Kiritimatiellae bacterium]|nr:virulence RhuM family protein [Kiritimatiellia bacterium]